MQSILRIFSLIFLYSSCLFSQEIVTDYDIAWHSADENILPQNSVKSIIKDKNGFIWLSTESGIVRYDGKNFLVFDTNNVPGLGSNRMFRFQGNVSKDSIYISNSFQEYALIKRNGVSFIKKDKIPKEYFIDYIYCRDLIRALKKINTNNGYYEIENSFITCRDLENKILWKVSFDTSKSYFFVFKEKLYSYDQKGNYNLISQGKVTKIKIKGLSELKYDPIVNLISQQVFFRDEKNMYCLASKNGELILNPVLADFNFTKSNFISAFYDDKTDILYLGSSTKGLLTVKKKKFKVMLGNKSDGIYYAQAALSDSAFLTDNGDVFCTSSGITKKIDIIGDFDGLNLMVDRNGNIWTKYQNFAYCYFKKTNYTSVKKWKFENVVSRIFEDQNGSIFVGLSDEVEKKGELYVLNGIEEERFNFLMSLNFIPKFIAQNEPNILWVTSTHGLYKINIQKKTIEDIKRFQDKHMASVYAEDKSKIWVATNDGLFLINSLTQKITHFPLDKKQTLTSSHCMIKDGKGFFWVSTNKGLIQVSRQSLLNYSLGKTHSVYYHFYDKSDGFLTNEFNGGCQPCGLYLKNNYISFPSMQGNVFFDSNEIKPLQTDEKIYFEESEIDNIVNNKHSDTLKLSPDFKRLRLFVRSPYYGNAANVNIEIKVEGPIPQDWTPLIDDNVVFTSLPPGDYIITARKLTGFDSKYEYSQKVLIIPKKPWQTTIFKLFLSFVAIGIGYLIFRTRAKTLEKRNMILEKKVEQRSIELYRSISDLQDTRTQLKKEVLNHKKLIATITHDIKSPLRFISLTGKNVYESINGEIADVDHLTLKEEAKAVYTSTFQLYNFVENLLEYAKISSQENASDFYELHGVVQKKMMMFVSIAESKKIELKNKIEENVLIYTNKLLLSIILHNLLDNALKNTCKGEISFSAKFTTDKTIIEISDTGAGMCTNTVDFYTQLFTKKEKDKNNIKIGMGFQMISELLLLLGGEIEINSVVNTGTTIVLFLPNLKPPRIIKN